MCSQPVIEMIAHSSRNQEELLGVGWEEAYPHLKNFAVGREWIKDIEGHLYSHFIWVIVI